VACVYCNYKEANNQTAANLLASVWMQLAHDSEISRDVYELYQSCVSRRTRPNLKEVSIVLKSKMNEFSRLFVVVDALDECSTTEIVFVEELRKLHPAVNLLVTSRHAPDAVQAPQDKIHIEVQANAADIRSYVDSRVKGDPNLVRLATGNTHLQEIIVDTVTSNARGMYVSSKYGGSSANLLGFCWLGFTWTL
jgi:hypothetical protein